MWEKIKTLNHVNLSVYLYFSNMHVYIRYKYQQESPTFTRVFAMQWSVWYVSKWRGHQLLIFGNGSNFSRSSYLWKVLSATQEHQVLEPGITQITTFRVKDLPSNWENRFQRCRWSGDWQLFRGYSCWGYSRTYSTWFGLPVVVHRHPGKAQNNVLFHLLANSRGATSRYPSI